MGKGKEMNYARDLIYDAKEMDLKEITPYYGDLIFGPEVFVEID